MKRDLDLARQLLLDIEDQGADCSLSVLRTGPEHDIDERIRYHLRLLIDARLLKEIDRTSAGIPCVRLTHDGHELLDLTRSDSRWHDAKLACQEQIDGLSLSVIRGILLRWAVGFADGTPHPRRVYSLGRRRFGSESYRQRPAYRVEPYRPLDQVEDRYWTDEDHHRYAHVRPDTEEYPSRWARNGVDLDGDPIADVDFDSTLPAYLI